MLRKSLLLFGYALSHCVVFNVLGWIMALFALFVCEFGSLSALTSALYCVFAVTGYLTWTHLAPIEGGKSPGSTAASILALGVLLDAAASYEGWVVTLLLLGFGTVAVGTLAKRDRWMWDVPLEMRW